MKNKVKKALKIVLIIFVVIIMLPFVLVGTIMVFVPITRPDEAVRSYVLRRIPMGTDWDEAIELFEKREWDIVAEHPNCGLLIYDNGSITFATDEIIDLAKKTINFLNNTGLSTIDFLYDKNKKKLYIEEINSIPTCFSHHLWEEANISYKELFTIMINDAIKNFNKDNEMITTMDMSVLKNLKTSDIREFK